MLGAYSRGMFQLKNLLKRFPSLPILAVSILGTICLIIFAILLMKKFPGLNPQVMASSPGLSAEQSVNFSTSAPSSKTPQDRPPLSITIDLSGAVANPDVYQLPPNSRIEDLLKLAGGLTPQSDSTFTQGFLNLSEKLKDGEKIYIPFKGQGLPSFFNYAAQLSSPKPKPKPTKVPITKKKK